MSASGPSGPLVLHYYLLSGDPKDQTLRETELTVLIPNMMKEQIKSTHCQPAIRCKYIQVQIKTNLQHKVVIFFYP